MSKFFIKSKNYIFWLNNIEKLFFLILFISHLKFDLKCNIGNLE
jgi:hypothetical protein